jgi:hypothetical protein
MFQPLGSVAARVVQSLRGQRATAIGDRARRDARLKGLDEYAQTTAHVAAAFGRAATINAFKLQVERFIKFGPEHPAVRARYGARVAALRGLSIETACACVDQWYRNEVKLYAVACVLGVGNRLSVAVLHELRLILRLIRRYEADTWPAIRFVVVHGELPALAAE